MFVDWLRDIVKPKLSSLNTLWIHADNFLHNVNSLWNIQPHAALFPVLKSNAYWHWLDIITQLLEKTPVACIAVDSFPEYQIVKKYSTKPILILWETLGQNYSKFDLKRTSFCVYNTSTLRYLWVLWKAIKIHIFLNTWMNREGVDMKDLPYFLEVLKDYDNLQVEWVLSHLHSADDREEDYIKEQIKVFKKMYKSIEQAWYSPQRRHLWNSAWIFKIRDKFFNAFRPWLALFWYNPLQEWSDKYSLAKVLKPVLSITSRIVSLHFLHDGDWVSYQLKWKYNEPKPLEEALQEHSLFPLSNGTYTMTSLFSEEELLPSPVSQIKQESVYEQIIASVPFWYAEGLPRSASWKIFFKYGKEYLQQIGTICMNLCVVLWHPDMQIGDEIELISCDPYAKNTLANLAKASDTLVYECLVRLDKHMRRRVVGMSQEEKSRKKKKKFLSFF